MLELWGILSTRLFQSLPGPLCPGVVAPDRVLLMDQIELNGVLMLSWIFGNKTVFTFTCIAQSVGVVKYNNSFSEAGWTSPNEYPVYDTKQCVGEVSVMFKVWRMRGTPSLLFLPGLLWPGVVRPDRVLSLGQIELNCIPLLNWFVWNRTVYMYKMDLVLNNLQWLMCHKTKSNQTKPNTSVCSTQIPPAWMRFWKQY